MIRIQDHTQGRVSVTLHIYTMDSIGLEIGEAGLTIEDAPQTHPVIASEQPPESETPGPIVLAHREQDPVEPVEQAPTRPKGRRAQLSDQCRALELTLGGPQTDLLDKSGVTERRGTSQLAGYLAMLQTRVSEQADAQPALSIAPEPEPETTSPSSSLFGDDDSEAPI